MIGNEIAKCLEEIGMPSEKVKEFTHCVKNKNKNGELRILNRYREDRVQSMHGIYKDLECLDYLIAQIEKEN